jgi:hypothetical protein
MGLQSLADTGAAGAVAMDVDSVAAGAGSKAQQPQAVAKPTEAQQVQPPQSAKPRFTPVEVWQPAKVQHWRDPRLWRLWGCGRPQVSWPSANAMRTATSPISRLLSSLSSHRAGRLSPCRCESSSTIPGCCLSCTPGSSAKHCRRIKSGSVCSPTSTSFLTSFATC